LGAERNGRFGIAARDRAGEERNPEASENEGNGQRVAREAMRPGTAGGKLQFAEDTVPMPGPMGRRAEEAARVEEHAARFGGCKQEKSVHGQD
jgi:hypothetical protein